MKNLLLALLVAARGRNTKIPLTYVRGSVDSSRYGAARQQHTRRQPEVVHWRTSTRRRPDGWRVSKRFFHGLLAAGLFLIPASVEGHHGLAAFDSTAEVTYKGTVTDFHFVNPHCIIEFDVKDDKGQVQSWKGEITSAAHLAPRGWTATSIEPGDELTITGYRAKNGAPSLWVNRIVLANGQDLKIDTAN
jgi:hypothetical protein